IKQMSSRDHSAAQASAGLEMRECIGAGNTPCSVPDIRDFLPLTPPFPSPTGSSYLFRYRNGFLDRGGSHRCFNQTVSMERQKTTLCLRMKNRGCFWKTIR